MTQLQLAREDDPASALVASHLAYGWYLSGQLDSALAERARAWKIDSSNLTTVTLGALVLLGAGRNEEARQTILTLPANNPLSLYVLGKTGAPTTVLERLQALERATNAQGMWFWGFGAPSGPILSGVRRSARFQAILRQVGMTR